MSDPSDNPLISHPNKSVSTYMNELLVLGVLGNTEEEQRRFFANTEMQAQMFSEVKEHYSLSDLESLHSGPPEEAEDPYEGVPHLRKLVEAMHRDYMKLLAAH
jgi:hypothetical protein